MGYAVTLVAETDRAPSEEAVDRLMVALAQHHGVVSGGPGHTGWSATVTVDARDAPAAAQVAQRLLLDAAMAAGFPRSDVAALEILSEAEQARRLEAC